jgi:hypothetical protein
MMDVEDGAGVCKTPPTFGTCWEDVDCTANQHCAGAAWCPCSMLCGQIDIPGTCEGPGFDCCTETGACPDGQVCDLGPQACQPTPSQGWCFQDANCAAGQVCIGEASCPCNSDCDMSYDGPGVCATPVDEDCLALDPSLVEELCDAASVVVFDGNQCVVTCLGCCGAYPTTLATFMDLASCQAACGQ